MVGRIPSEGLEVEELESDSSRRGVVRDVEVEEDEVLRGIRGRGAPALLALRVILCGIVTYVAII